ncbi:hypothetical protein B9Z19DRAFT_1013318 [Tuber borchii]|uniref:Secreted protein n=1 Tax=Tuber borchii TaxID=42251 RepID=A0A2T6Z9H5_TUBBO|nr:hypothetical protein B9Z19DRAFT_1013318 [Tuber borchii]
MPWFVLLISGGAWVALREYWFHLTEETDSGVMVSNLTVSSKRSRISSAVIPIRIPCYQVRRRVYAHSDRLLVVREWADWWIPLNLVQHRVYALPDCLLSELAG